MTCNNCLHSLLPISSSLALVSTLSDTSDDGEASQIQDISLLPSLLSSLSRPGPFMCSCLSSRSDRDHDPVGSKMSNAPRAARYLSATQLIFSMNRDIRERARVLARWLGPS